MGRANKSTLVLAILIDAGRHDYPAKMPFVSSQIKKGKYVKKLFNPGGYCERTCFMTGALPQTSGSYFAMSLMPIGYKRAHWEPQFNVPPEIRNRLCMIEDNQPDTDKGAFGLESIWDVMRREGKSWIFEACLALGIQSHKGRTTHGSRVSQMVSRLKRERPDFAYWQISRVDQEAHVRSPDNMDDILIWADGQIERVVNEARELYEDVKLLIFGDHGQTAVTKRVDPALEYPPYQEGWDYMYLKSSAAIQFWVFNDSVTKHILNDPKLKIWGKFVDSPSKQQGDLIWAANPGTLVSPCHFHSRYEVVRGMHGYQINDPDIDSEKGFAIIIDGKTRGTIKQANLNDLAPTICDLLDIPHPESNEGKSLL